MIGGVFSKHRFKVQNSPQHPYKHLLSEFPYVSPSLPGVTDVETALNYIIAVLYPQTQANVANVAALPTIGNTINDFRVVDDDGDGKAAAYRWEQREGEAVAAWHKIYDMDWGADSILEGFLTKTQDLYVKSRGNNDLDINGTAIVGLYAGQSIFGGASASTNLSLFANSGDGVGAGTGYVQVGDHFRPCVDSLYTLGTNTERWLNAYVDSITSGTLTATGGSITDSSGAISFGDENLTTTGDINGKIITASDKFITGTLTLDNGSITDTGGSISFDNENLSTTGTFSSSQYTATNGTDTLIIKPNISSKGEITSSLGTISFDNENLITTGTLGAGAATFTQTNTDNIRLDGNTISITNLDGNLILVANGTGIIDLQTAMTTIGQTVTGVMSITGQLNIDNFRFDGNVFSTTNTNGNITFTPNGTGFLETSAKMLPDADGTLDLGSTTKRFNSLFIDNSLGDGTNLVSIATLLSLRDINVGASSGMTLFYDGSKWNASVPDTEIDHGTITGLADDDHTQYALLAGRGTGQTLIGGLAASNDLTLESTAHGTKGFIKFSSTLAPTTTASFSTQWDGTDLGGASNYIRDMYTKGQHFGFRLENVNPNPSPSSQNVGRLVYNTSANQVYVDNGSSFQVVGRKSYSTDTSWNGTDLTKTVVVSTGVSDARLCIVQFLDNTNNYETLGVKITRPSATQVTITTEIPLPAGSYRLILIEVA